MFRYAHFQRKDCFVSRNEALRSMALKYEREKREAEQKLKSEREARLGIGLNSRQLFSVNSYSLIL